MRGRILQKGCLFIIVAPEMFPGPAGSLGLKTPGPQKSCGSVSIPYADECRAHSKMRWQGAMHECKEVQAQRRNVCPGLYLPLNKHGPRS